MLLLYKLAAGLFFLLSSDALSYADRVIYGEWSGKPGDKLTESINLLGIFVSVLLFCWGAYGPRGPRFNRVLPLVAAGLLLTSALWSVMPSMTITRGVAYFFVVVGAIGIVEILDTDEVMSLTASVCGALTVASLFLIVLHPNTLVEGESFRGLFPTKNVLGQAMAVGVLASLHGIRIGGRRRLRSIGVTVLFTVVAFLSKSTTALLTIFAYFIIDIVGTLYIRGGARRMIGIYLAIAIVPTSILLMMNVDLIFSFLEKDSTLTGRTELWPYVIDSIYERPVLGWGFAAFWLPSNPAAMEISDAVGWYVTEAHNGFLQFLLDIGVVGTAFFLFLWMRNLVMAVKCMNGVAPEIGVSALLLLVGVLLIGASEQVLTTANWPTAQFFLLGFMCEKELRLAREARAGVVPQTAGPHLGRFGVPRQEDST